MIQVEHVTKTYGSRTAVRDLCFEIRRGEVVGFLGPNGAGKTTTMRMMACFLPPSGGKITIAGFDTIRDSLEVRSRVGYMAENVPLYPEMRVKEYLRYRAKLKGVRGRRLVSRMDDVLSTCGLEDACTRILGQLSKGYRQRVGLADALIHEPEVLILDEPSIGLDPNQIRHMRTLVRGLAERFTVLLSSHMLSEVETVCERVLIINNGRIVASDSPGNLMGLLKGNMHVVAEVNGPPADVRASLEAIPEILRVDVHQVGRWHRFQCECAKDTDVRERIYAAVQDGGWSMRELASRRGNLEDVFVAMTAEGGIHL